MFWDQNPGIYYMVTTTGQIVSNTWPAPVQYTKNAGNGDLESAPIVLKNGTLIMFFSSKRGNSYNIYSARYTGGTSGTWSTETALTNSPVPSQTPTAIQDGIGKIWLAWTRKETGDINIRFVDTNGDGVYDPGEPIIYDSNGNGRYDTGEPVIAGTAPAVGSTLSFDPRIGFIDANGNNLWDPGEFVVYDPNLNAVYDPKLMYLDSNNDNVWDLGESIVYKANSTVAYFSGSGRCAGTSVPSVDCVIIGAAPSSSAVLKVDPHIKVIDRNLDGVWEPGELLVYDANNNGVYDTGEAVIAPLSPDPKLKYIGAGTTWASGNTVVYDTNGNGLYDGKIKFVDDQFTGHWVPGDTVVYDVNMNNLYDLSDTPIFETSPQADLTKTLKNDPALRFIDSNGNGVWDPGEAVVYDSDTNGIYDGYLKFVKTGTNTTWVPGETVVYDSNGDGKYSTGKYYNDTIIAGPTSSNNTALSIDPNIKFYDINDNMVWNVGEPVVYDANGNSLYDAEVTIAGTVPVPGRILKSDPLIKFAGAGTSWTAVNPVVYDSNNNGVYDTGEPVIGGTPPANQTLVKFDPKIEFVNATANPSETWTTGKSVVYDANGNSHYDAEPLIAGTAPKPSTGLSTGLGEQLIVAGAPNVGTPLKIDPKIMYYKIGTNSTWVIGETIVYDSNGNGVYDSGEPILVAGTSISPGTILSTDPRLKYADTEGNGIWDSAEPIVYDNNSNNIYDFGEYVVRGTTPLTGTVLASNIGEPWVAGPAPLAATSLKSDAKIKFVDLNGNLLYDPGEPVEYDSNNNGIFDAGDIIITTSPAPPAGTAIKPDEMTLGGTMATVGTKTILNDPKIKFVDANANGVWDTGETVVYDLAGNNKYVTGKYFNDTIIAGAAPLNNTSLSTDSKLKYLEQIGGTDLQWNIGEPVFYDSNNNGVYDAGEPTVALFQAPSTNALLKSDPKLKYFETGADARWDPGETVVYDSNGNGVYDTGEPVITGPVPDQGTILTTDSNIKFVDTVGDSIWHSGETVVYDSNANGKYDPGDTVIVSSTPAPGSPMRTVTHIFYRIYSGGAWQPEQRLTTQPSNDATPSMTQTLDGRVWLAWAAERSGGAKRQIVLRTTVDGVNWAAETQITSVTTYGDGAPSISQDRNGTIWIAWSRNVPCSCGQAAFEADLFYTYSTNNGSTWATAVQLTSTTGQYEIMPNIVQLNDKNLYMFFSTIICGGSTCTADLYYFKTQILTHSARMNSVTAKNATSTNPTTIRAGQTLQLNASVTNLGDYNDSLVFWAKANSTLLPHTSVYVLPGQTVVIIINWVISGIRPGRYTITGNITDSNGESIGNLVDNYATPFNILIRPAGDVNSDCVVNIVDLVLVAGQFGKSAGSPGWNPIADLNGDGHVDITDLAIVGSSFGQTC